MKVEAYIDGASRGNPGDAGIGIIAYYGKKKILELGEYIGQTTNNFAEYMALIRGLEEVLILGYKKIKIHSDSELLVKQINGEYRVKNDQLKILNNHAEKLISKFNEFSIEHTEREGNKLADKLANKGIDSYFKKQNPLFNCA